MITLTQFQQDIAEQQRRRAAVAAGLPADPPGAPDAAVAVKARKPGKRGRRDGEAATMAHEMAEGAMDGAAAGPGARDGGTAKSYESRGITRGPGQPVRPGEPPRGPGFRRPAITDGHAALSPGHEPPNTATVPDGQPEAADFRRGYLAGGHAANSPSAGHVPHVDMSGSRGVMRAISPSAPMGPGGAR